MTTRCNSFIIRMALLAMLAVASWAIPATTHAQASKCACDHYTILVDPAVTCGITVCYQFSPDGPTFCQTVSANTRPLRVSCPVWELSVQLCPTGSRVLIPIDPAGAICTEGLVVAPGCCVRACYTTDANGCPAIKFIPGDCAGPDC